MKNSSRCIFQLFRHSLLIALTCISSFIFSPSRAQDNIGTDFWVMFGRNADLSGVTLTLNISSGVNTSGVVSGSSFASIPFTVTANEVTSVVIPASLASHTSDVVDNKGIHITAMHEISVNGMNHLFGSSGSFLALPSDAIGKQYTILSHFNTSSNNNNTTSFGIVGTVDNTVVTIIPSVTTLTHTAGVPYSITINQGSAYELRNISSSGNLSGTQISSTQPIGVFGMHSCARVGNCNFCDHICEMLPPTTAWGVKFLSVPLVRTRVTSDYYYVLARDNSTTVKINGEVMSPVLNAGQWRQYSISESVVLETDKPVMVAQYALGASCSGNPGDPLMMLIPPYEQFFTSYTLTTASGLTDHYINIIAPDDHVGNLTRNGIPVPVSTFTQIGSSGFSGAQIPVEAGFHTLSCTMPFGCFMYGFDNYDGYGYSGGQSYSPVALATNLFLTAEAASGDACTSLCWNALVKDQNNNPLQGVRVDFNIIGESSANSGFAFTDAAGNARFCYTGHAGLDSIIACIGMAKDTLTFTWSPTTSISNIVVNNNSPFCEGGTLNLNAYATGATSYSWSGPNYFVSTQQNPSISQANSDRSGNYTVIINGCASATTVVAVNPVPVTSIVSSNSPVCLGNPLNLSFDNYCKPPASKRSCEWSISSVTSTGGISNFSSSNPFFICTPDYQSYNDYSKLYGVTISPGSILTINATVISRISGGFGMNVWIDYDDNGIFSKAENVIKNAYGNGGITRSFVVADFPGTHRMRIRGAFMGTPQDACDAIFPDGNLDIYLGETEDYHITITGSNPVSWYWTGPNGFTSTQRTPSIPSTTIQASGTYTVTATTQHGCSSSASTTVTINPQLAGNYTINSALPTGGSNFNSFHDVLARLICGITGPVAFQIDPSSGPYIEPVKFPEIPGTSAINTITFYGNGVELRHTYEPDSVTPVTLELNGADYMRFNDLVIATYSASSGTACYLSNGSDNNIFTNCTMQCVVSNGSAGLNPLMVRGGNSIATNYPLPVSINNIITGCTIKGGQTGISIEGHLNPTVQLAGTQIINCIIQDFYYFGITCRDVTGTVLSGNIIERPTRTNVGEFIGIALYNGISNLLCEKNRIRHPNGGLGPGYEINAWGISDASTTGSDNSFINNVISDFNYCTYIYGINLLGNAVNTKVYHNTIFINSPGAVSTAFSGAFGIRKGWSSVADVRNNIIDIRHSGYGVKVLISDENMQTQGDIYNNNNLFLNSQNGSNYIAIKSNINYTTFSAWQAAGYDLAGSSVDPGYTNSAAGDFKPANIALNNMGAPLGILTDIEGLSRNSVTPDPGAFEMETCSLTVNAGPDESTFFGYSGDQQITRTTTVTGGMAPFTYSWSAGRALSCNSVTASGDEIFSGGTCVHTVCPTSGTLSGIASCSGSASVTVRLIDTTDVCVTVTDANNCTATDCFTVNAIDARCFAGNSQINKVYVCHYTGNNNNPWVQICIDDDAVSAHLANNSADYLGHCNARYAASSSESPVYLNLYPNPARNEVAIGTNGISGSTKLQIINVMGQVVISQAIELKGEDNFTVNVSSIVPGIYKVVLLNDRVLSEGMFVKE